MGNHASNGSPKDSGGSSVVNKSSAGVGKKSFPQELCEFDFISEERASNIDALTSDNCHSLP